MDTRDQKKIRQLFDDYLQMYATRNDRLTAHFSEDFLGFTGCGDSLVKSGMVCKKNGKGSRKKAERRNVCNKTY